MTKYEELMAEFDDELIIEERPIKIDGLYCDGVTWIREDIPSDKKLCVLAEEIGHYLTSSGDILDLSSMDNARQEHKARKWAYEKLLPKENIIAALRTGAVHSWELAELLEVDEEFLLNALIYYGIV